jgi:hypothetical protein
LRLADGDYVTLAKIIARLEFRDILHMERSEVRIVNRQKNVAVSRFAPVGAGMTELFRARRGTRSGLSVTP